MAGRKLFEGTYRIARSIDSVRSLIGCVHNGKEPMAISEFFRMNAECALLQYHKKDCLCVITPNSCICPASSCHPDQTCNGFVEA